MDFGFGKFSLVDSSDVTKGANVTTTGLYNSLNVVIRNSTGSIIDSFGGSGGSTATNYSLETGGNLASLAGLITTAGGQIFLKAGLVATTDIYVRGNVPEGSPVSDPVYFGVRDASGNAYGIRAGQQTAANSVPVILPSATITLLTPPAAITNFANETGGNLAAIKTDVDKIPSQGLAAASASTPVVTAPPTMTTVAIATLSVTNAGTVQIASIPSVPYELTLCNNSDTDMYWGWATGPTAVTGVFLAKAGGSVSMILPASKSPYFYCASTKNLGVTTRTL